MTSFRRKFAAGKSKRDQLILENLRLANAAVRKYLRPNPGVDAWDLYGEGVLGLIAAAENFDLSKANQTDPHDAFVAYAWKAINTKIYEALRERWTTVRLTKYAKQQMAKWNEVRVKLETEKGHSVTFHEVCDAMGTIRTERGTLWSALEMSRTNKHPQQDWD